jgi:hypothetical protein
MISIRPSQYTGVDTPMTASEDSRWSAQRPRRVAAVTPTRMPTTAPNAVPSTASSTVKGSLAMISETTGEPVRADVPMSPWTRFPRNTANWVHSGSSSPSCSRIRSTSCWLAWMPAMTRAGSPGRSLTRATTMNDTPSSVTADAASRRPMYSARPRTDAPRSGRIA